MQRVLEMAEGIDVGEMPSYELVSSAEAKKRPNSSDGSKSKGLPDVTSTNLHSIEHT